MSGSGYDAVVDIDDEVRTLNALPLELAIVLTILLTMLLRATLVTPISKKTSNSTLPTSMTQHLALERSPQGVFLLPRLRPPAAYLRSASSGPCPSTRSSSMSILQLSCRDAGLRCIPAQISLMCWRATPTCTDHSGLRQQSF